MCVCCFFSDFLSNSICCGYSFELHRLVDAIQMGTQNICLYKDVDKKYTGCNLKTCRGMCGNYVEYGIQKISYFFLYIYFRTETYLADTH